MQSLHDSFGRRFSYLRLSLIDACNFSCIYCLPGGYKKQQSCAQGESEPLSLAEIRNLATAFAELGMWKIRLTGGEPTLRRDLVEIVHMLGTVAGIRKIALSTNGYTLKALAPALRAAGVSALNVSVDTLDAGKFEAVTGSPHLAEVLAGIDAALALGFPAVKVNAVLLGGMNDHEAEFTSFLEWARAKPLAIRFIELMPTAKNKSLFKDRHVRGAELTQRLTTRGWRPRARAEGDGPAVEFEHPDYLGKIGVIAPYGSEFCTTCNRLRVTSRGALRLCLFAEGELSLRALLASPAQKEELKNFVRNALLRKEVSHHLPEGRYGNTQTFSAMGG